MYVYLSLSHSVSLSASRARALSLSLSLSRARSLSRREQSPTRGGRRSASHGPVSVAGFLVYNINLSSSSPKASHGPLSTACCLSI